MLAVRFLFFASNGGWNVPIRGTLISLQSSGSLKSKGDKVRLACTMSGFNLYNDSLSSFSALGEGIV